MNEINDVSTSKNGDTITRTLRINSFHKYGRNEYKGDKTFKIMWKVFVS
jgi:hypothetical protein